MTAMRWILVALTAYLMLGSVAWAGSSDEGLDRSTPRRTFEGFRAASENGDFDTAAKYLDLRAVPRTKVATQGPELAHDFSYVIARRLPIDPATLPDVADADDGSVTIGTLTIEQEPIPITLSRVKLADGVSRWLISKSTVAEIPQLDATFGPTPWQEKMPAVLQAPDVLGNAPWQWAGVLVAALVAAAFGRMVAWSLLALTRRILRRAVGDRTVLLPVRSPLRAIVALLVFRGCTSVESLTLEVDGVIGHLTLTLLSFAVAWLAIRILDVLAAVIERSSGGGAEEKTRGLHTQLVILRRIAAFGVGVVALAVVLLQFEVVRSVGAGLLASAGVAGIVLGLAAQKSLGAVLSGIQLSLTQPIRIGDTVVVEGELGSVEEVHLTFVIVKVWDERRLVAPISKFLDQPFENWSKLATGLRGVVTLQVDFQAPVPEIRKELERVCGTSDLWDERVCKLEVTDANAQGMTLRAVVSARNPSDLWDLRCAVRESLVTFAAKLEGGKYLIRVRSEELTKSAASSARMAP